MCCHRVGVGIELGDGVGVGLRSEGGLSQELELG